MDIKTLSNKIKKLNINAILKKVFQNSDIKAFIIEKNQEQLYNYGQDAKGKELKTYAALGGRVYGNYTIQQKQLKGQPTDRVTLKDTGKFYNTFKVGVQSEYAEIKANFKVHGEDISENVETDNVLGIQKENMPLLIQKIKPYFIKEFKESLFKK